MTGIQWLEIYEPARAALMRLTAQADRQAEAAEAARQSDLESCAFDRAAFRPSVGRLFALGRTTPWRRSRPGARTNGSNA